MAEELKQFEDPGLKAAVRRAWGGECCPLALRRKVLERVGGRAEARRRVIPLRPLFGLAAAALVLLAVGLVWHPWQPTRSSSPIDVLPASGISPLPVSLADDLTYRHDECSQSPVHTDSALAEDDPVQLARQMQEELNFPVITKPLPADWHFRGAAFCPVGRTKSAHLMYDRDGKTVSVFSLPAGVWPGDHLPNCAELTRDHHAVAGMMTRSGFYCVVGSAKPPVPLAEVRGLLDQLRAQLADEGDEDFPGRVTIATNR